MATTKQAKLADSNDGVASLNFLLDAIHGASRKTAGNGLLKGK